MDTHGYSPDDDRGPLMMGFNYALLVLSLIIYSARIATRVYPKFCMTAADYTVTLAMVSRRSTLGSTSAPLTARSPPRRYVAPSGSAL
jgi:hypothetical protein